ncbi:hypothetical protein SADUNF_Sadunf12G0005200 [Salix dunnii]|uniref:Uncharacterized protein n=1 Tax=Salix dunnii TaxID=1413687 RepID=A0A835JJU7_9ROSI|nr:hypothetical protein SADUNF_Sadunf12G0005200 [Salix dunnii]
MHDQFNLDQLQDMECMISLLDHENDDAFISTVLMLNGFCRHQNLLLCWAKIQKLWYIKGNCHGPVIGKSPMTKYCGSRLQSRLSARTH